MRHSVRRTRYILGMVDILGLAITVGLTVGVLLTETQATPAAPKVKPEPCDECKSLASALGYTLRTGGCQGQQHVVQNLTQDARQAWERQRRSPGATRQAAR